MSGWSERHRVECDLIMNDQENRNRYYCLAGHDIPAEDIEAASETVLLDGAARVRVCREHGCPIAIHREAPARASGTVQ